MKDDIRNIIDLENITRVRNSLGANIKYPSKNSLVKLIPLEYLKQGVKVLIDGKLFIAFIDGKIPIKEEIIAYVTSPSPLSLSLDLSTKLKKDENLLIDHILQKFELAGNRTLRNTILKVVEEGNVIIKSKLLLLAELLTFIKVEGLELSLLINLVWNNNDQNKSLIEDLYYDLFDESFEQVCSNLYNAINELLFTNLPQYITQQIRDTLIYNPEALDLSSLVNKSDQIFDVIKLLNEDSNIRESNESKSASVFINYGTKYILQKSILKEYDYYPDFIVVKREAELSIIHYSVKKIYNIKNQKSYKIVFKQDDLPFKLTGIVRDKILLGEMEISDEMLKSEDINSLEECLYDNWGFRTDIRKNEEKNKKHLTSKINSEVNKLVS